MRTSEQNRDRRGSRRVWRGAAMGALWLLGACAPPDATTGGDRQAADGGAGRNETPAAWDQAFEDRVYSPRLPIVWLELAEGWHPFDVPRDEKVTGRIRVIETHDGTHRNLREQAATLDSAMAISVRGSSSAGFPQKSYTVEILKRDGTPGKARLLDMPSGEDWALVGCWGDKTCMRNALGLWMGRQFGYWSSRTRFVEVYLNGRYNGIHLLAEAIRSERSRVAIPRPAPAADEGDITGGYIFRREAGGKGSPTTMPPRDWLSPYQPKAGPPELSIRSWPTVYTYHYPRHHTITAAQRDYLKDYMARFEEMMDGPDWKDPKKGYPAWIDVTSWIDYALLGEASNDIDHYFKSVYWVKASDRDGGKLYQMPAWDFDRVFGNAGYRDGAKVDNLVHRMNQKFGGECTRFLGAPEGCAACAFDYRCVHEPGKTCNPCHNVPYLPFFWEKLWMDPGFHNQMKCRWQELRKTAYNPDRVKERIGRWKTELSQAILRHYERWQLATVAKVVSEEFLSPHGNDIPRFFQDEVDWLVKSVTERIAWLDRNLPGTCRP